jgi:hypothetical protein
MTAIQLDDIKQRLSIESDTGFSRLLGQRKYNPGLPAPPLWCALLSTLNPFRFDYI